MEKNNNLIRGYPCLLNRKKTHEIQIKGNPFHQAIVPLTLRQK